MRPSPCQDTQGVFPHGYARIPSGTICVVPSFLSTIQTGGAEDDSNIGGVLRMARSKCLSPYLTEKSLLVAFFALCEKEAQRILPFLVGKTRGRVPPSSFSFPGSETGSKGNPLALGLWRNRAPSYSVSPRQEFTGQCRRTCRTTNTCQTGYTSFFWQYSFSVGLLCD